MSDPGMSQWQRLRELLRRWAARTAQRFAGMGEALLEMMFFWR
ncbi:MAG: hypothetical protein JWP54_3086 [Cryobacterium sp.]|jgi:hypothetical protein|nr:hypothetical protein [Cryobacterium sp.]